MLVIRQGHASHDDPQIVLLGLKVLHTRKKKGDEIIRHPSSPPLDFRSLESMEPNHHDGGGCPRQIFSPQRNFEDLFYMAIGHGMLICPSNCSWQ